MTAPLSSAGKIAYMLVGELTQPVGSHVHEFVKQLLGNVIPVGVMFYGSALKKDEPDAILDFYIIVDKVSDWPGNPAKKIANALLPPNVEYHEYECSGRIVRGKVAILTVWQFRQLTGKTPIDITVWARFVQPSRLVWVRNPAAADKILSCLIRACATAVTWAAILGPRQGPASSYWGTLFRHTYLSELRMENSKRPESLLEGQEERYTFLLREGWRALNIPFREENGEFIPGLSLDHLVAERESWVRRERWGRPLNTLRVIKAVFTFRGGVDYVAWKIRRHQGVELHLTPFERKHPLLSFLSLGWKLKKSGVLRFHKSSTAH